MSNKALPKNVHLLKGTHRKDRHGPTKEKHALNPKVPPMPGFLPIEAQKEWQRITCILKPLNVLTDADRGILTQYCVLAGELSCDPYGFPATKHTQMRMCEVELGITPSSRNKAQPIGGNDTPVADPWSEL